MKKIEILLIILFIISCRAKENTANKKNYFELSDRQKAMYVQGMEYAQNVSDFNPDKEELDSFIMGLEDKLNQKNELDEDESLLAKKFFSMEKLKAKQRSQSKSAIDSKAYFSELKKDKSYIFDESGIIYKVLRQSKDKKNDSYKFINVTFVGKKIDGTIFDDTHILKSKKFDVDTIIPCWKNAISIMNHGEKIELVCPAELAFGHQGLPPLIHSGEAVIFDFELLDTF